MSSQQIRAEFEAFCWISNLWGISFCTFLTLRSLLSCRAARKSAFTMSTCIMSSKLRPCKHAIGNARTPFDTRVWEIAAETQDSLTIATEIITRAIRQTIPCPRHRYKITKWPITLRSHGPKTWQPETWHAFTQLSPARISAVFSKFWGDFLTKHTGKLDQNTRTNIGLYSNNAVEMASQNCRFLFPSHGRRYTEAQTCVPDLPKCQQGNGTELAKTVS